MMNPDSSGKVTFMEFRNFVRKLGVKVTSKEIDQLMMRIDSNNDGMIDFNEFANKF
jgi:Ca2+-binding EF-hand superfamily protein